MTLAFGWTSRASRKGLGLSQLGIAFGKPFEHDKGSLIRFSLQTFKHWRSRGESRSLFSRPAANMDSYANFWRGFHIGRVFEWRHYGRIATHISVGPFTVSFVRGTWIPTDCRKVFTF